MQDKTSLIEIIDLLEELEKQINANIIKYNYYIDVVTDRFPFLEENEIYDKIELRRVHDGENKEPKQK